MGGDILCPAEQRSDRWPLGALWSKGGTDWRWRERDKQIWVMGLEIEVGAFVPSIGHGLELDGRWRSGRLGHFGPWQAAAEIEHLGWIESHRWLDWEIHFRQAFIQPGG